MPKKETSAKKTWVMKDRETLDSNMKKNSRLADLLQGAWKDLTVIQIERIEEGASNGWQLTYRESGGAPR